MPAVLGTAPASRCPVERGKRQRKDHIQPRIGARGFTAHKGKVQRTSGRVWRTGPMSFHVPSPHASSDPLREQELGSQFRLWPSSPSTPMGGICPGSGDGRGAPRLLLDISLTGSPLGASSHAARVHSSPDYVSPVSWETVGLCFAAQRWAPGLGTEMRTTCCSPLTFSVTGKVKRKRYPLRFEGLCTGSG